MSYYEILKACRGQSKIIGRIIYSEVDNETDFIKIIRFMDDKNPYGESLYKYAHYYCGQSYLCGYVGVPRSHPMYEIEIYHPYFNKLLNKLYKSVGELSFSGIICIQKDKEIKNWFFGFDLINEIDIQLGRQLSISYCIKRIENLSNALKSIKSKGDCK